MSEDCTTSSPSYNAGVKRLTSGFYGTGLPVGVSPDFKYESFTYSLKPGDAVVMLTDGLSEAMNGEGQLYGIERLRAQLHQPAADVNTLGAALLSNV